MDDGSMTLIIALVFLVACSAFFSASETAFSSLNQIRLKSRAEDGDASAARVLAMAEKYDKLLSTILIGNNIVNIAAASIGTILFTRALGAERGATMSTIVLTIVVLIFGEVTPKSLAKEMPETVATAVSPMLNLLMVLFTPLTWLFSQWKRLLGHFVHSTEEDTITEGELMTMVSEAENDGELTDRESELIRSAIEFDDVEVEEILTPRVDVVAVEDNISLEQLAQTFAESGYSRLPVYHDTIDNIEQELHRKLGCEAVIHMDPIATDDSTTVVLRNKITELAQCIDPALSIHDFRMVPGPTHTNLIFDIVVPHQFRLTDDQVVESLRQAVKALDARYEIVVNVDKAYTAPPGGEA